MIFYRFTASWCQPCKSLAKNLEMMSVSLPTYDIDDPATKHLQERFNIRSVPTIVVENKDGTFESFVGANISPKLRELIKARAV